MNPRERKMAILLGAFIVLGGGGFFLYQFLYVPWQQQEARKKSLEDEIFKKKLDLIALTKELPKLATWRMESLPSDPVLAKREYYLYLLGLLNRTRWTVKSFSPGQVEVKAGPLMPDKKAIYTSLIYTVEAQATEAQIVDFLQQFAKTPLMHKIKSLVVDQPPPRAAGGKQQGPGAGGADMKGKGFAGFGKDKGAGFGKDKGFAGFGKDKGAGFGKDKGAGGFAGFGKDKGGKGRGGFGGGERLPVRLQVEALIVGGPGKHWTALSGLDDRLVVADVIAGHFGGPVGLAQIPWVVSPQGVRPPQVLAKTAVPRNYSDVARALLFSGQPEPKNTRDRKGFPEYDDVTQFAKLYLITWDSSLKRGEAKLYNLLTDQDIRLREEEKSGYKQFVILDDDRKVQFRGTVLKISDRAVYFSANDEIFALPVGDSVADAMQNPVPEAEAKRLGLIKSK
jgi:hypothetical protein